MHVYILEYSKCSGLFATLQFEYLFFLKLLIFLLEEYLLGTGLG